MDLKKKMPLFMAIAAGVSFVSALIILIFAVPASNATYKTVLEVIISCFMILLSLLLAAYLWVIRDVEPNFFLFDRVRKKNIPVEDLTFSIINERMNFFLTLISESPEDLWYKNALERDSKMGPRRIYRPLLAYKMLFDLSDKNTQSYWDLLITAPEDTVNSVCDALAQGGEQEMVKVFRYLMANYRQNPDKIKDFICGNQRYFRGRMKAYIQKNIEFFY
ncbi:MAG: hypothetical protein IJW49_02755 [Clostridia bacterium]|nr:hypothetical protein [Clostridia bacterium]